MDKIFVLFDENENVLETAKDLNEAVKFSKLHRVGLWFSFDLDHDECLINERFLGTCSSFEKLDHF